jgi:hypothetical protein
MPSPLRDKERAPLLFVARKHYEPGGVSDDEVPGTLKVPGTWSSHPSPLPPDCSGYWPSCHIISLKIWLMTGPSSARKTIRSHRGEMRDETRPAMA